MFSTIRRLMFAAVVLYGGSPLEASVPATSEANLPRFTGEREAAALYFLHKHAPDLLQLLEQLKKEDQSRYRHEIRAVFQVTEMLADLQDNPRRHDLELEIWKTESKAHVLVASLSELDEKERPKADNELQKLASQLVDLDVQVLELKAEQTEKELGEIKEELTKTRDQGPARVKARYDKLLDQGRKRHK